MKVLLAVPEFVSGLGQSYDFPLGIAYISAAMKTAGHDVHCLNLNNHAEEPKDVVADHIRAIDPDVFGSGSSPHFNLIEVILKAAKAAKPDIVNLVGGGVVSAGAARLHLKQAKILRETNGGDDVYFDRIGNMIDAAGEPRYFN